MTLTLVNILLLFGLLQSFLMTFLIVATKKWNQIQNGLLMALLLVVGVSLIPPFIGNSGVVRMSGALQFLPMYLSIFIFPLLFLYLKSIFTVNFRLNRNDRMHLLIPSVFWLYSIFIWGNTMHITIEEKGTIAASLYYFEMANIQNIVLVLMVGYYTNLSFKALRKVKLNGFSKDQQRYSKWFRFLLLCLLVGFVLDLSSQFIGHWYGYWKGSPLDEWLGISFPLLVKVYYAIIVYIISVIGYTSYTDFVAYKPLGVSIEETIKNYLPQIIHLMEVEKLFLDPTLSLTIMAKKMNTTTGVISSVLNNGQQESFNDFVNKYRIAEVKEKLRRKDSEQFTLMALAEDSGFKSKTTFYRAFQKFTKQTPKSYLKDLRSKN